MNMYDNGLNETFNVLQDNQEYVRSTDHDGLKCVMSVVQYHDHRLLKLQSHESYLADCWNLLCQNSVPLFPSLSRRRRNQLSADCAVLFLL